MINLKFEIKERKKRERNEKRRRRNKIYFKEKPLLYVLLMRNDTTPVIPDHIPIVKYVSRALFSCDLRHSSAILRITRHLCSPVKSS